MQFGQGTACLHQLTHGDVVVLESLQSSSAYAVEVREAEGGSVAQLQLTASPVEVAAAQPAAALEVVQQGEWVGLRSLILDGLFLQARKKAPSLVFFSNRLGVWEQWKVEPLYQGVLQQHSPAMCLTSRQVSSVSLSVRAWRVGSTAAALPIHVAPQPLPASGLRPLDASAGYALTYAGSGGGGATMTSAGRIGTTEGGYAESVGSSSLQDEALELSHNVVKGYVTRVTKWPLFLAFRLWRAEARAQRSRRAAAAASAQLQQEAEAALAAQQRAAVERHQRHMMLLACQCWARLRTRQLSRALQDWHVRARRSGHLERLRQLLQRSLRHRHMATALGAWSRYARDHHARLVQLRGFYLRMASRRARAVLLGWREAAAEQRFAIAGVQLRRGTVLLAKVLRGWWGLIERLQAARQRAHVLADAATDAALFSILHAWRGCCLRRQQLAARAQLLLVATARRILATAWGAWRDQTDAAAERRQRAGLLAALRRQHEAAAVLRHWAVRVAETSALRFAADQMGARRRRRLLPAVFTAWRAMADLSADLEDEHSPQAATRCLDTLHRLVSGEHRRGVLRRLLAAWRRLAADGVRRAVMADAMRRLLTRSRAADVLLRWRELLRHQSWLQSELLAVYRQGAARKALQGWADVATGKARLASTAALVGRRLWRRRLSQALGSWRAQAARAHGLWNAAGARATVSLARRMLQGWRRRCDVSRAWLGALGRCRGRYERILLASSMRALHARVSLQQRVAVLSLKCGAALARRALRGWRHQAVAGLRLQSFGRLLHAKWRRTLSRAVLRSWFLAAHSACLQLHLLEALEAASLSGGVATAAGGGRDGAAVLPAWQAAWPAGWAPGAAVAGFYVPPVSSAAAGALAAAAAAAFDRRHAAVLRLLVASLGGAGAGGGAGNGGSAAMWAAAELLLTRLPVLAKLAGRVRRRATEVLRAWHARASYMAGLTRTGVRLQRRRRQLLLGACLRGWSTTVTAVRARRGTAMLLVRRAVKVLGVECLRAWRQAAARAVRLRRTVLLLLGRRVERLERAVLRCWLEEVHETRMRRDEARRIKADARLARMRRTLGAWQEAVAAAGLVRVLAERRFAATWMRFKREVLLVWRNVVELSQQHLTICVRLVRKRTERRCAGAVLGAWRAYAQHERERRENWPLLCRVFLAWLTLVQPAGRAAQAARERLERLEQESATRRSTQRREHTEAAAQLFAAGASPGPPADSDSSVPTALRAATAAPPEPATVASPVSVTGPAAAGPPAAPSAPASISASAPASATAAAAAAASEPPDLSSLPSLRPIIVGPSTVEAAGSPVPGPSEDGRSSPPVEEVHFANRRRSTRDTDNEAGAMVAQAPPGALGSHPAAYMWQQWHNMMQTERANSFGGGAGAIPLPFGAWGQLAASVQAAAEGGDAAALKDRLGKLEEAIKTQREQEEAAKAKAEKDKESASSAPVAASSPPAPAYRPPPPPPTLAPTGSSSARVMTASCRPEPGPMYQIRQGNNTTVGRASTNSLTGLATVDSGNSANAPSPSTTPPPGGAAAAAPAAPAAPTVHVVVHNPYGGPAGPYDPSRPDSPTGGDSMPLGWNWSRRATTDAVVAAAEALLERRSRKKLDVPPMQPAVDEDEEDGAVTTVPYEGPGATRAGRGGGRGAAGASGAAAAAGPAAAVAAALAAAEGSSPQQQARQDAAAVGGGGSPGEEPMAQPSAGVLRPVQVVVRASSAGTGEDLLLPLTPVAPGPAAGTSSGAAADAAADGSQLPPQLRFQLGPPPKRVSPAQAPPWQQQQPRGDAGADLQAAAHPDALPLQGDGYDGSQRSSAGGGGGATLFQPTARRAMSRLSNASLNYSAWGAASAQLSLPPSEQQQEPPQQPGPGRPGHGQELGMPLPLLLPPVPQHGDASTGAPMPAAQDGQQPIVLSPNDSQEQQALQQHPQQQGQQQPITYITQHLVDGRTVVYAQQGAAGPAEKSSPQPQQYQQQGPQALTCAETQQQHQHQHQQRPDSGRAQGRHRVSFAPEAQAAAASGQPSPPLPTQQPQPGVVHGAMTAQGMPGAVVAPGLAAAQLPAGVSPLPPGWVTVPSGAVPPAAAAGPGAAAAGWQGAAPGTAFAVLYPPAAAGGTSGLARGMLVLHAAPAPVPQQALAPAAAAAAAQHASNMGGGGGGALAAAAPDVSDMDALLEELEARSRAAMTSPRRGQGARLVGGAGAGGGGGRPAYGGHGARAATAGGAMVGAAHAGGGSGVAGGGVHVGGGGGLQGLDAIDSLHVRATTLSAPGAPVFGSWGTGHGGAPASDGQAAGGRGAVHTAAAAASGVVGGGGLPSEVDAALRRLEAASVHAHAAAAAWTAVAQQVEEEAAESGERDMSRLAAAVEAAAAAATAAATSSASAAERTARAPAAAAVAREAAAAAAAAAHTRPGSGGRAQAVRAAGAGPGAGGAADLLATFLPGAQEAVRRHAPAAAAAHRAQQQGRAGASPRYSGQEEAELDSAIVQPFRAASRPEPRWLADASAAAADSSEQWAAYGRAVHLAGQRRRAAGPAADPAYLRHSQPQGAYAGQAGARSCYEEQQQQQQQQHDHHQLDRRRQLSGGSANSDVAAGAEACPTCGSPTRPSTLHSRHAEAPARGTNSQGHALEPEPMQSGREGRRVRWSTDGEHLASAREQRHLEAHADLDDLSELAMLAQRRGNTHLAAALAALSGPSGGGAAREPSPREPAHAAVPPPVAIQARSVPGAASAGRGDALPPPVHHGRDPPSVSSVAAHPPRDRTCTRAPASAPPTPPRFVGGMAAAAGGGGVQPPFPGALAANLPRRPSTQGSASSVASSSVTSAADNGGPTLPALIDVDGSRLDAFDPDPLGSPLKGVLGECRRLQAAAVRREEEGHAVVREVVSGLSPRSAVAAALRAVMEGPPSCGGAVETVHGGGCLASWDMSLATVDRWNLTTDTPSDTFTPRQKESQSNRIDFHRGVDMPCPIGSGVFAIETGYLYRIEASTSNGGYDGIAVYVKHNRATGRSCKSAQGIWFSVYMHLNATKWNAFCANETHCQQTVTNATILKGERIASSGAGYSEFPHLHFEIRDAPMWDNCSSNWQADAINPFRVLPYNRDNNTAHNTNITVTSVTNYGVNYIDPQISVNFWTTRFDWNRIEVVMRNSSGQVIGTNQVPLDSGYGQYNQYPNFYDIEIWNRANACPYCPMHTCTYDPNTHNEKPCSDSNSTLCFNGVRLYPYIFNSRTTHLGYDVTFNLTKPADQRVASVTASLYVAGSSTAFASTTWTAPPQTGVRAPSPSPSPSTSNLFGGRKPGGRSPKPKHSPKPKRSPKPNRHKPQ
ncbi:hypothetical protein HYH02_005846 [Chlamydomonas schloesseri]|uniref:Sfi1 spindle body domain-containing protein n=1 Tax=Chlamydomonas schloesseri TaxID=2026947 RepID=A0A835WK01_9CHLO|nr:hypothetical protein HYH02_005846 [Chlamydomonas schloesseri]|eukprot:KAG2449098.1 hypothetical protein HYH02_005846 [Chlamydomonas schloesseri]